MPTDGGECTDADLLIARSKTRSVISERDLYRENSILVANVSYPPQGSSLEVRDTYVLRHKDVRFLKLVGKSEETDPNRKDEPKFPT